MGGPDTDRQEEPAATAPPAESAGHWQTPLAFVAYWRAAALRSVRHVLGAAGVPATWVERRGMILRWLIASVALWFLFPALGPEDVKGSVRGLIAVGIGLSVMFVGQMVIESHAMHQELAAALRAEEEARQRRRVAPKHPRIAEIQRLLDDASRRLDDVNKEWSPAVHTNAEAFLKRLEGFNAKIIEAGESPAEGLDSVTKAKSLVDPVAKQKIVREALDWAIASLEDAKTYYGNFTRA